MSTMAQTMKHEMIKNQENYKTSSESKFFIQAIQDHLLHADEERLRLEGEVRILTLLQKEYSDFKSFS